MKAVVVVTPKTTVLDPQGEAVRNAIHNLGMECVGTTRIGKYIEMEIDGSDLDKTRDQLEEIAKDLLSNPVIEDYRIELSAD
ncbi:MAG: phosphoribosylformylglycinamidine synthase subunit PurS [Verrucomicrobiota bacterium]